MNLLCRIGLHDWKFNYPYDPDERSCPRCDRFESSGPMGDDWKTPEAWRRYHHSKIHPTEGFKERAKEGEE